MAVHHVTWQMIGVGRAAAVAVALGIGCGIGCGIAAAAPAASADSAGNTAAAQSTHTGPARPASQRGRRTVVRAPAAVTAQSQSGTAGPVSAQAAGPAGAKTVTAAAVARTLKVRWPGQPPIRLKRGTTAATELSGIAYGAGNDYYAVGDNGATTIWQVDAPLRPRNGKIKSALVTGGIDAPMMGSDSEGITLSPERTSAWVSDEVASTIDKFSLVSGLMLGSVSVPSIYRPANLQGNFGLESLSYGAGTLWTGNEEALKSDGPLSTTSAGSWVRLQSFTGPDQTPQQQYAYRTDPIAAMSPFTSAERSGLVDMLALPDGQVLTLERELGGFFPLYRTRVYLLDFTGATDVSEIPSLSAGGFTPTGKKLLWQGWFTSTNFEGITLGPALDNGSYPLVLVSDDGQGQLGQLQTLFSLNLIGMTVPAGASSMPARV
ncbi:MAG: esterase-like activity of phytase family protein [Mycobacterium sp.]